MWRAHGSAKQTSKNPPNKNRGQNFQQPSQFFPRLYMAEVPKKRLKSKLTLFSNQTASPTSTIPASNNSAPTGPASKTTTSNSGNADAGSVRSTNACLIIWYVVPPNRTSPNQEKKEEKRRGHELAFLPFVSYQLGLVCGWLMILTIFCAAMIRSWRRRYRVRRRMKCRCICGRGRFMRIRLLRSERFRSREERIVGGERKGGGGKYLVGFLAGRASCLFLGWA